MLSKKFFILMTTIVFLAIATAGVLADSWDDGGYYGPDISGSKITVMTLDGELSDGVEAQIPEFEKRTGAEVEVVPTPGTTFEQDIMTKLASGSSAYDVIICHGDYSSTFLRSGWFEPLNKYFEDPQVADPNVDVSDFVEPPLNIYKDKKGNIYSFPYKGDAYVYFYRQDLLEDPVEQVLFKEEYGYELQPAETWQQFFDIGEFFYRPDEDLYGSVITAEKTSFLVFYMAMRLYAQDVMFFDEDMKPQLDTPEAMNALEALYWEIYNINPPNVTEVNFDQMNRMFAEGKVAQIIQWPGLSKVAEDEEISKVKGNVGTANLPSWTKDDPSGDIMGGWFAHVSAFSRNKVAAYKFIEWATSKSGELVKIPAGNDPVRSSNLTKLTAEESFYGTLKVILENANTLPKFEEWPEFQIILQDEIHAYLTDIKSAEEALNNTQNQWLDLLKEYDYIN